MTAWFLRSVCAVAAALSLGPAVLFSQTTPQLEPRDRTAKIVASPGEQAKPKNSLSVGLPQLVDITASTGINFNHLSSPEQKYIVESMSGGVALIDYERDGWPDIYFTNAQSVEMALHGIKARSALFHNNHDGTFTDVAAKAVVTNDRWGFGVAVADYDNDGWPDMYVTNFGGDRLYHNNHDGTFTDVAVMAGVSFNEDGREQAGMGTTIADYNGDGRLDIFKTNFSDDTPTLYRNDGEGIFSDVTFAAGLGTHTQYLGWGTMFFDFDNDSWPDLILANGHVYPEVDKFHLGSGYLEPRVLYHNNGNGTFTDISAAAGPGITTPTSARGLAVGDLWNDGQLSVVINNIYAKPSLLVNTVRSRNHWIAFKTIGTRANRDGIGAKITLKIGKRILVDEVRSGSSYISQNDLRVHFGLGAMDKVETVQVRWPSGLVEHFDRLAVDTIHTLKEGTGAAIATAPKKP